MKINRGLLAGALLLISGAALAQAQPGVDGVQDAVTQALAASAANLIEPKVMGWLGVFVTLQFVLSNIRMLLGGADLEKALAKLVGAVAYAGLYLTAVTYGPEFIDSVGSGLLSHFLSTVPSTNAVLAATVPLATTILAAAGTVSAANNALASILVGVFWVIAGGGVYLAFKVLMFYLELGMIVLLSPISFALLGLDSFKEQGIAPIKSLVSLVYRAVLFGAIFGAFKYVSNMAGDALNSINWWDLTSAATNVTTLVSCLLSYPLILLLAFKSDSIAATLASGSSSLGNSDVGQAVAAGVAAGAAVAAAGSATTGAAAKIPQSMAGFMDKLAGGGGSISNASPMGTGGGDAPVFAPTAGAPSLSVGAPVGDRASASAPPSRPSPPTKPITSGLFSPTQGETGPASASQVQARGSADGAAISGQAGPESASQAQAPGSADGAAIGGPPRSGSPKLEETLEKLTKHLTQPKKPTLGERLGEANRHLSQEQAETRISMSPHHYD